VPKIPRGDLQTTFVFKGFDEGEKRLGLRGACAVAGLLDPPCWLLVDACLYNP
jgi:hypothetical protein